MRRPIVVMLSVLLLSSCAKKAPVMPPASVNLTPSFSDVIPLPSRVEPGSGPGFAIGGATRIVVNAGGDEALRIGRYLADFIGIAAAADPLPVEAASGAVAPGAIQLVVRGSVAEDDESYEVVVAADGVTITAPTVAGLFYGVQTFRQLLPPFVEYEAVRADKARTVVARPGRITDRPRYGWRGTMLDVSRHFFGVDDVKRFIDLMALYKLNRLHLGLSNDQGWRIEIASWPNLASRGGSTEVGGGPGGFYTQAQYRDIVQYAADRFVTIVPEIDVPGHTNAALASYPELNCDGVAPPLYTGIRVGFSALCVDKEITYRFLDDVIREIAMITPGRWFHLGGDEVKTLTPAQYNTFIERVQGIVRAHGKQVVGWDEIASANLDPSAIVQVWRPKTAYGPAIGRGAKVIMSIGSKAYLDMKYDPATPIGLSWAGLIGVRDAYEWDPATVAPGVASEAVLGVEAPLWSETLATIRDVEFLAFPRLAAIAEVAWTAQDRREWGSFRDRLAAHGPRLSALGVNFYRSAEVDWK